MVLLRCWKWYWLIALVLALLASSYASAHRLRPAVVTAEFSGAGALRLTVRANFEQLIAGISAQHQDTADAPQAKRYDQLRALSAKRFEQQLRAFVPIYLQRLNVHFDGTATTLDLVDFTVPQDIEPSRARVSEIVLNAAMPTHAKVFTWQYPAELGSSVLRIAALGQPPSRAQWLKGGALSEAYSVTERLRARSTTEVAQDYVWLGFTHILPYGIDHVLFVIGIFLLAVALRPLFWQVTAFTVAHSITLSLAVFGVVELPETIVEPLIALSIAYVGIENVLTRQLKPWRVLLVFTFGLLHGMGFAGVLTELRLPPGEAITAIIAFNVGVELGQLSVIGGALLLGVYWIRDKPWFRARVVIPTSLAISAIGLYWTVEGILESVI